jgi:hypothetical protein
MYYQIASPVANRGRCRGKRGRRAAGFAFQVRRGSRLCPQDSGIPDMLLFFPNDVKQQTPTSRTEGQAMGLARTGNWGSLRHR